MPNSSTDATTLVSVIIPTYNRAHCLGRAIASVLSQTYANLELIVVDDASCDGTADLIGRIEDPRLRYIRQPTNRGASAARNAGLREARGELIAFQDSDDEWLLDKLEVQMAELRGLDESYGAIFGGKLFYGRDRAGNFGPGLTYYHPDPQRTVVSGDITAQLLEDNLISPQTILLRRPVIDVVGGFDETIPANNDWEFMLRMSRATKVHYDHRPVVVAFMSEDSISLNLHKKARSLILIVKKHDTLFRTDMKNYRRRLFVTSSLLMKLEKFRFAERFLAKALRERPWSAEAWARLARLRLRRMFSR